MVTGFVFGVALLVSSAAASPAAETSVAGAAPLAVDFSVPLDPVTVRYQPQWARAAAPRAQPKTKKFSPTDRVIAVAAGVAVGWVIGGAVGFKATSTSNPYDDTSGLKGMMIGAPIGGATGGILGYWLTNR